MVRQCWLMHLPSVGGANHRAAGPAVRSVLLAGLISGCVDDAALPSQALSHRFDPGAVTSPAIPADLNGDGIDVLVTVREPTRHPTRPELQAVQILRDAGEIFGQANFPGQVIGLELLDTDDDGLPEIMVPFVRNDSLFVTALNAVGGTKLSFFLADGVSRTEAEGRLAWDPTVAAFHLADADGDGANDLVSIVSTGYARLPRGVLIHRLPTGELIDRLIIGAPPHSAGSIIEDLDGDGTPEIAFVTAAVDNGAVAGGFDDQHGYLVVLALRPLRVIYSRVLGGIGTWAQLSYEDFDGDGKREFFLLWTAREVGTASLELIEPLTWQVRRRRDFSHTFSWSTVVDINRDTRPEILLFQNPDSLLLLDGNLDVLRRRRMDAEAFGVVASADDLDGDGLAEILALTGTGVRLLNPDLSLKASLAGGPYTFLPDGRWTATVRRARGARELVLATNNQARTYRLIPNPFWPFYRWRLQALWLVVAAGFAAAGAMIWHFRSRARGIAILSTLALEDGIDGLLRIRNDGRIVWTNRTLQRWLGEDPRGAVDRLGASASSLADFCARALDTVPPRPLEDTGPLPGGNDRHAAFRAEPLRIGRRSSPEWLVRVRDVTEHGQLQEARAWTMLAQRVAHDLKNPLTSLLLTLQRLVMEYQSRAPEVAPHLDEFADRMAQRIAQLRRMTANFMKFVEADQPEPRDIALNVLVTDAAERIRRGLAADIRLLQDFAPDSPVVRVDPEQFDSVLENLVSNAVNAMPDGGCITLATGLNRHIRFVPDDAVMDWAVLEVLDTGRGIPPEALASIFEAGFSRTENGSGLGLTIVRRIVERHGGRIRVESELDTGSVFSIYLPAAISTDAVNAAQPILLRSPPQPDA